VPALEAVEARTELVRRWLRTFGPGTTADVQWWTGWSLKLTRAALAAVDAVEVELDSGPGWVLPDDTKTVRAPKPWVALLPALDPTVMGWKERAWYLGDHGPALFDRNGNAGPTVMVDGRVVGGWAQRADGPVVYELLEPVPRAASTAIAKAAKALEAWFGDVRGKPRFPTPLQKTLGG
jgi:Winged helix DNA-binding domain